MNDDSLFDVPVQLSPRLAWLKAHGVSTWETPGIDYPWAAAIGPIEDLARNWSKMEREGNYVAAHTEDEAIVALALANGWMLCNETTQTKTP